MKILICPDSFKGTLTAEQACEAIAKGILQHSPDPILTKVPMADGGCGTLDVIQNNTECQVVQSKVRGPLGSPLKAKYLILDENIAFIEMAQTAGLTLIDKEHRNPMLTTTYGVGELMIDAYEKGCRDIILGLGGSGTNDCGMGMAQALGVKFLDNKGEEVEENRQSGYSGGSLQHVERIDISNQHQLTQDTRITIASDVNNPLTGPKGATHVYGPQKGATADMVPALDQAIEKFAHIIARDLGIDVMNVPGAGAAGGLGAAIIAFLDGEVVAGVNVVMNLVNFEQKILKQDLIITGEGKIDYQTAYGKTIYGIASAAKKQNIPVIAIGGCLGDRYEEVHDLGIKLIYDASEGKHCSARILSENAFSLLQKASYQALRSYLEQKETL